LMLEAKPAGRPVTEAKVPVTASAPSFWTRMMVRWTGKAWASTETFSTDAAPSVTVPVAFTRSAPSVLRSISAASVPFTVRFPVAIVPTPLPGASVPVTVTAPPTVPAPERVPAAATVAFETGRVVFTRAVPALTTRAPVYPEAGPLSTRVPVPVNLVAPVPLPPPPWMLSGLLSSTLPLMVCEPVVLLSGLSVAMAFRGRGRPAKLWVPLSTTMLQENVALAGAPLMLRNGTTPYRLASWFGTPSVTVARALWLTLRLSVPLRTSTGPAKELVATVSVP